MTKLPLHFQELFTARDAKSEIHQVVGGVGVEHDTMVPVVHPQVAPVDVAIICDFHADDVCGEVFPFFEVLSAKPHVPEFGYLDHFSSSIRFTVSASVRALPIRAERDPLHCIGGYSLPVTACRPISSCAATTLRMSSS